MSALGKPTPGGTRPPSQSSSAQNTAVKSGSRPGAASVMIETSSPSDPRTLERAPAGWLK